MKVAIRCCNLAEIDAGQLAPGLVVAREHARDTSAGPSGDQSPAHAGVARFGSVSSPMSYINLAARPGIQSARQSPGRYSPSKAILNMTRPRKSANIEEGGLSICLRKIKDEATIVSM